MSKIAIIDLETTGLDPRKHEIIEIGMVIFDDRDFSIVEVFDVKVKPMRIHEADKKALEVNGYDVWEWQDAISLNQAMLQLYDKLKPYNATFCAHNMIFDWSFLAEAERETGIILPFDYHKIDLLTLAWSRIPHAKVFSWSLKTICTYLRVPPEPKMHRALNGALAEYAVFTRLMAPDI